MVTSQHNLEVSRILRDLGQIPDLVRAWRNETGMAISIDLKRKISYGLKGSADILGLLHNGRFLAIEVKTGKAVQSKQQKNFQSMVEKFGGIYLIAREETDIKKRVETMLS
jgi:hypothetical protein